MQFEIRQATPTVIQKTTTPTTTSNNFVKRWRTFCDSSMDVSDITKSPEFGNPNLPVLQTSRISILKCYVDKRINCPCPLLCNKHLFLHYETTAVMIKLPAISQL